MSDETEIETPAVASRTDRLLETFSDEQMLRFVIFHEYADAEYGGDITVQNMNAIYEWIMDKAVPGEKKKTAHLREVKP